MYKITVQEKRTKYGVNTQEVRSDPVDYYETTAEITSDYAPVVAGFLRALADKLDPPKAR